MGWVVFDEIKNQPGVIKLSGFRSSPVEDCSELLGNGYERFSQIRLMEKLGDGVEVGGCWWLVPAKIKDWQDPINYIKINV